MRRKDKEVIGFENILEILNKCEVVRLGFCDGDKPYIVPMNFAYKEENGKISLYFHCAKAGRKLDIIAKNNNVCFEADLSEIRRGEIPCRWGTDYESVVGGGVIVIADEAEKIPALNLIMRRYGFEGELQYTPQMLAAIYILRLDVTDIAGKRSLPRVIT